MRLTRDTITESIARIGSYGLVSSGLIDYLLDQAGGAITIDSNMIFKTDIERDAYFQANPDKKVEGAYISNNGTLEQWSEEKQEWVDVSLVVTGPKGQDAPKFIIQYSATGFSGWSETLNPALHKYWRWSTDGGLSFSPNGVAFVTDGSTLSETKFGLFNYDNSIASQEVVGGVWTTLMNDTLGVETNTSFSPSDIDTMIDPATGRILLNGLQPGDEVYIRHTVNVIPSTNNTTYAFSHYFGEGATAYRLPIGIPTALNEGGGVPTGDFLVDTHFFVKNENVRDAGMLPQVLVSNDSTIEYTGCYISVTRR